MGTVPPDHPRDQRRLPVTNATRPSGRKIARRAGLLGAVVVLGTALALTAGLRAAHASSCTASLGGTCGPYGDSSIPMSNGYNTYVMDQKVGPQSGTAETLTANDPGS